MNNNYGYGNKNRFEFDNEYNDFLKKQEADRNKLDNTYDQYLRSAREMSSNASGNKKKTYFGTGSDLSMFKDDMNPYKSIDTSAWDKNYGTGKAFSDSWNWNEDIQSYAQDEYDNTQSLLKQHGNQFDSVFNEYQRLANEISRNNQKAAIQKNQNLLNMRNMSTASGRGGLGSTITGYRRADNNFMNTVNQNNSIGNSAVNGLRDSFEVEYEKYVDAIKGLERQARNQYGDVLVKETYGKLHGYEDDDTPGWLDAESINPSLSYLDQDGSQQSVDSYLTAIKEQELIDRVNKIKSDNQYFLNNKASDDIFEQYRQEIKNLGSKNEKYQSANKYIAAEQQKAEATQPEYYAKRGAAGHANVRFSSYSGGGGLFGNTGFSPSGSTTRAVMNGKNYVVDTSKSKNNIAKKVPKAMNGDVVREDQVLYVKHGANWYRMIEN